MRYRTLLSLCLIAFFTQGFTLRDQGFFELSVGPSFVKDVTINKIKTEYKPGPSIETSVGLAYTNGLGIGIQYLFNFNPVKGLDISDSIATEFLNSAVTLDFIYKAMPAANVTFFIDGGPGMVMNTDQNLKSTASTQTTSTVTTANSAGDTTSTVTTSTSDEAASPYESQDNFAFGYKFGGGIEYREDGHKAYIFQVHYLNTLIHNSTFNTTNSRRTKTSVSETVEGYYGSLTFRYYF